MAALQRAVAGGDHDDVAVGVGQALGLDVPRTVEVALHEALAAAEGGDRLAHGGLVQLVDLVGRAGDLEAAAAAAERRLDGDGQPVLGREGMHLVRALDRVGGAGHQRGAGGLRDVPRADLVAEGLDGRGRRADPDQPGVDDGLGELGVLRQEPVAGVHRVRAGAARDVEQLLDVEVGVGGALALQRERLVGEPHVQRVPVGVGVDGDGGDSGVGAGAGDADGDLATVRDEDLADGGHGSR